jgi:hypothetical protein
VGAADRSTQVVVLYGPWRAKIDVAGSNVRLGTGDDEGDRVRPDLRDLPKPPIVGSSRLAKIEGECDPGILEGDRWAFDTGCPSALGVGTAARREERTTGE